MTLEVQKYLRDLQAQAGFGASATARVLAKLKEEYGVDAKQHSSYRNLYNLKYGIESEKQKGHPIVKECRGLILDATLGTWKVVAHPFNRFYNFGEHYADEVDWEKATVQEKLDGSLMIMYYYGGNWIVATSGTADAGGPTPIQIQAPSEFSGSLGKAEPHYETSARIFRDLFWEVFGEQTGWNFLNRCLARLPKHITFMFELCTNENRVVVRHLKNKVVLLGARENQSGQELRPGEVVHHFPNMLLPQVYPVGSAKEAFAELETMKGEQQEGYVVMWPMGTSASGKYGRAKLKCPSYSILHHLTDGMASIRRVYQDIVFKGETDEFAAIFPEHAEALKEARERLYTLLRELGHDYRVAKLAAGIAALKGEDDQKAFALACKDSKCPGALFSLRKGQVESIREFVECKLHIDSLLRTLGYK